MVQPELRFTRADYDCLPEGLRVELIGGALLKMPSPILRHQAIVREVNYRLTQAIGRKRVFFGPVDFMVDDENVLVPDIVAFAADSVPSIESRGLDRADLVVEVLSPSTASRDRGVKSELYLAAGVGEVWLIDGSKRTIEIRTPAGTRVLGAGEVAASEVLPEFSVKVADLLG